MDIILEKDFEVGAFSRITVIAETGSSRDITLYLQDDPQVNVGTGALLRGTLIAPNTDVVFLPYSALEGSVYANSILMTRHSSFSPAR